MTGPRCGRRVRARARARVPAFVGWSLLCALLLATSCVTSTSSARSASEQSASEQSDSPSSAPTRSNGENSDSDTPGDEVKTSSNDGYSLSIDVDGPEPRLPVTVQSADGTTAVVKDISRIVVLRGAIAEVVYSLGLGDNVVGRDVSTTFTEADDVPLVTHGHDMSAESVMSLKPSVVLADTDSGPPEAIAQIRSIGVPVIAFDPVTSVETIHGHMTEIASALGLATEGAALAERTMRSIEEVADRASSSGEHPHVAFLYLRGTAGVYLLGGPGSGADSMIAAAGGTDVGTEMGLTKPFTPLTSEALVLAAPDILLLTTTGLESVGGIDGLLATPGIAQTPAGAARRIVTLEDGLLFSFGTRTPTVVRNLASKFAAEAGRG
ncbi:MAG: ABC transporter substrate-binding protein [Microthrixaceae bacterium]